MKEIEKERIIILIASCFFILFGFGVLCASVFAVIKDFVIRVVAFPYATAIFLAGVYGLYVYFSTKDNKQKEV